MDIRQLSLIMEVWVGFTLKNDSTVNYMYRFEDGDLHISTKENGCRYDIEYKRGN